MTNIHKNYIILAIITASIIIIFSLPQIPQFPDYHDFVDNREFINIPNFNDVISNIAFLIVGFLGLRTTLKYKTNSDKFKTKYEYYFWLIFFLSASLVSFGSAYYHLEPNNLNLIWDRLPITLGFVSLFCIIIMERMRVYKFTMIIYPGLILFAIASLIYWYFSELRGEGDLRAYILVQAIPILILPLLIILYKPQYSQSKYLIFTLLYYLAAKIAEFSDKEFYNVTFSILSGHTLKHYLAALAVYMLVLYINKRSAHNI